MRHLVILIVSLFCLSTSVNAQKASVKGSINDTLNKLYLSNATVLILRAKDSVLLKYTPTYSKGTFELNNLPASKAILIISYPSYADYTGEIDLSENNSLVKNDVPVITKAKLFEEVIIKKKLRLSLCSYFLYGLNYGEQRPQKFWPLTGNDFRIGCTKIKHHLVCHQG